jgi:fructose-1,6-bisphosphatase I
MAIVTLEEYILERERQKGGTGAFSQVIRDITLAARLIHHEVNRAGLVDILGSVGRKNVQGEEVQKLDVFANETFIQCLSRGKQVSIIASEENEDILLVENAPTGKYIVLIDPLDGSSNIDVNVAIGSIFTILKRKDIYSAPSLEDVLQPGRDIVAAGYIIYSSSTVLIYSAGNGVNGFTLDPSYGEFFLSHPNIRIPEKMQYYSFNDANYEDFTPEVKRYVDDLRKRVKTEKLSSRYIGSLVADFHRNLLKGGLFLYPGTQKSPEGKLRLLFEAFPMAFLMEQAGGAATNGTRPILDLKPEKLHQRVPLFLGPKQEIERIQSYFQVSISSS